MSSFKVCFSFDVDMANYNESSWAHINEMESSFLEIKKLLIKYPELKTTWFFRIDSQVKALYGEADFVFVKYEHEMNWLKENGHEIGWHHHAYRLVEGKWLQDTNEESVCTALWEYGKIAQKHELTICRMGWGFQTNKTIKILEQLNFIVDSSAIPRPNYKWDLSVKDWTLSGQQPYYPSVIDYRINGDDEVKIVEVPINTIQIETPTDTEKGVMRYINPAYKSTLFKKAVHEFFSENKLLVTICHPYEIDTNKNTHSLLSFSIDELESNIVFLLKQEIKFVSMKDIYVFYKG